jgi:chromosome segregation ATPase
MQPSLDYSMQPSQPFYTAACQNVSHSHMCGCTQAKADLERRLEAAVERLERSDALRGRLDDRRAALEAANRRLNDRITSVQAASATEQAQLAAARSGEAAAAEAAAAAKATAAAAILDRQKTMSRLEDAESIARDAAAAASRMRANVDEGRAREAVLKDAEAAARRQAGALAEEAATLRREAAALRKDVEAGSTRVAQLEARALEATQARPTLGRMPRAQWHWSSKPV